MCLGPRALLTVWRYGNLVIDGKERKYTKDIKNEKNTTETLLSTVLPIILLENMRGEGG
jgi:hypothetical protein